METEVKVPIELLRDYVFEGHSGEGIEFIRASGWKADGKYQVKTFYFRYENQFLMAYQVRSGSPFSDYHYEDIDPMCSVISEAKILMLFMTESHMAALIDCAKHNHAVAHALPKIRFKS